MTRTLTGELILLRLDAQRPEPTETHLWGEALMSALLELENERGDVHDIAVSSDTERPSVTVEAGVDVEDVTVARQVFEAVIYSAARTASARGVSLVWFLNH